MLAHTGASINRDDRHFPIDLRPAQPPSLLTTSVTHLPPNEPLRTCSGQTDEPARAMGARPTPRGVTAIIATAQIAQTACVHKRNILISSGDALLCLHQSHPQTGVLASGGLWTHQDAWRQGRECRSGLVFVRYGTGSTEYPPVQDSQFSDKRRWALQIVSARHR